MNWKTFEQRIREEEAVRFVHELNGSVYQMRLPTPPRTPKPYHSTCVMEPTKAHLDELKRIDDPLVNDRLF